MRRYAPFLIIWTLASVGCALSYIPPVHQGNFLSTQMIHKVRIGMTESQVVYLLGTPALKNPFSRTSWTYVFYRKASHLSRARIVHLRIIFSHGRVTRIIHPPARKLS